MFAVLAGIFALSFVALGVGTGVSGGNLGDVIRDVFGGGSDTPSVADALEQVQDNPGDAEAVRDLASAYVAAQQYRDAAATLEDYVELRPDDAEAIRQLTTVYARLAAEANQRASQLLAGRGFGQSFAAQAYSFPGSSGLLGALGENPIEESVDQSFGRLASEAGNEATRWQQRRADAYEKLAAAQPDEPTILIQLASAATAAGNNEQAVTALEQYLEREPEGDYAEQARQQLEQLNADVVTE